MTVFHSAEWMQVLQETYGFEPVPIRGDRGALLPLMEAKGLLAGKRGVGLPFTDHCQPMVNSQEEFDEVWHKAVNLGRDREWKYIEIRGGKQWLPNAPAALCFYGHGLDLTPGDQALLDRFESNVRRAIRKAEVSGLTAEIRTDLPAMRRYYQLHCDTRRKHGLPPQPWTFFLNIHKHLVSKGLGVLVLAQMGQIASAGAVFFYTGKQAIYKFGASDKAGQSARANNLVMWEGMRWLAGQGCEQLDLGRTSMGNQGLRRFKAGWGSREWLVEYVKYDVREQRFMVDKDRATGWHNQIFRIMPMVMLRAAGAILYRQMT